MSNLASILTDPNYVNANEATKRAIFDKFSAQDTNFTNANPATQEAIRVKFGVAAPEAPAPPSGIPGPRRERGFLETIGAPIEAVSQGIISGGGNVMLGGQRLLGKGLSAVGATGAGQFLQEDAARRLAESQATVAPFKQEFPILAGAGELAGEVVGTGPAARLIAAPLQAAGATRLAQAVRTGGFSTGAPVTSRAADLGIRAAGGAVTGGATAAVINPAETGTGALTGAGVGVLAPGAINLLVKGAGKVVDARQMPNQLAGKIAREALGSPEQIAAARAAMQQAQAEGLELTAQQALARYGVISPAAQATLEKAVRKSAPKGAQPSVDTRAAIEAAQESARQSTIKGVTPDLQTAIDARRAASAPLYKAADKAVVALDDELSGVISRMPEGTLAAAANIAKIEGRPFIMGKSTPA